MRKQHRRDFFRTGAWLATGGLLAATATPDQAEATTLTSFSRWRPSRGGDPESPDYLGKLVPGLRAPGLPPVTLATPDLKKLPYEMQGGRKTFRLTCEPVKREFLPGYRMDVWGFNQTMPGPTIECVQGDRVRVVVTNKLPEATSIHWHGLEIANAMDGVMGLTQDAIPPGGTYTYEFDLHQAGSFFYHPHMAMQEAMGMVGWFIIHPKVAYDPVCDRDFGLIFQNFAIEPNQTIPDTRKMDWNWHTINGRSAPLTTPLLVKHGERVRLRILNFSPEQHHPVHLHGHSFWLTGTEAGRIPRNAWIPRNNTLIGVATVHEVEFVANNPGDWMLHCHMMHHMMNHMVYPAGPGMRMPDSGNQAMPQNGHGKSGHKQGHPGNSPKQGPPMQMDQPPLDPASVIEQQRDLPTDLDQEGAQPKDGPEAVPGYPQDEMMMHMAMPPEAMARIMGRKEVAGMRKDWHMALAGMMTVVRVMSSEHGGGELKPGPPSAPQTTQPHGGRHH